MAKKPWGQKPAKTGSARRPSSKGLAQASGLKLITAGIESNVKKLVRKNNTKETSRSKIGKATTRIGLNLKSDTAVDKVGKFSNRQLVAATRSPIIIVPHLTPARVTVVYNTYWRFAAERQHIFFQRAKGTPQPWTSDPILATYKFTNTYRAADRVSQYLIRNVIYRDDLPKSIYEVCFRILLFKLFNKIETWELLERSFGSITYEEFSFKEYDRVLSNAIRQGIRIYSAAYIMPPGDYAFGYSYKHRNHLALLQNMLANELPDRLREAKSMNRAFDILRSYPTIGDFLAYQFVTDINYSEVTNFSEMEFVVPGPGAKSGIRKCFANTGGLSEPEIIRLVTDLQNKEFERLGLNFQSLWGRPLQLIDCQNLFCEVDKYSRVKHPNIEGLSGRTQIKQKYTLGGGKMNFWFPPKWKINDNIR